MVQLRVDVEAANARRAFEQTARAVDNLGDQLTQAEIDAVRLEDAMEDTTREAARLRAEVNRLGSSAPQQLRDDLLAAERAAMQARIAFQRADAGVDQLERSLADARREAGRLERELNDLDADAGSGARRLQRGLIGQRDEWRNAGREAAQSFSGGFSALPIEVRAAAGLAAAGVATMLGGAIGGAITAGVGGGVMAVAIKQAMTESNVAQQAMADNFRPMQDAIKAMSLGFEDELVGAAVTFGNTWDRISGDVDAAFEAMEAHVGPLADGIAEMFANVAGGDGFTDMIEAAGPVLDELARSLPLVGTALNDMFESIADGEGNVKGMRALMLVLVGALRFTGEAVEFLSDGFDTLTDAAETFFTVASRIPVVGGLFEGAAEGWRNFNEPVQGSARYMDDARVAADGAAHGLYVTAEAANRAAEDARKLNDELTKFIDQALAQSNAAIAYERAIDALAESFKENGRSTDISTKAGQDNVDAMNRVIDTARRKMQQDIEAAGGEKATAAAVQAATAAYRAKLGELERQMLAAGKTKAEIDALLGSYRDLAAAPPIYKTITYRVVGGGPLVNAAQQSGTYQGVGGKATGGPITAGTPYIVGERGPELIVPNSNAMVYTAAQTSAMMGAGGRAAAGGGGPVVNLQLVAGGGTNDALYQLMAYGIRTGALRLTANGTDVRVG